MYKPKQNIHFFGFGVCGNYFRKDTTLILSWAIDAKESEEHRVTFNSAEMGPDKMWDFKL